MGKWLISDQVCTGTGPIGAGRKSGRLSVHAIVRESRVIKQFSHFVLRHKGYTERHGEVMQWQPCKPGFIHTCRFERSKSNRGDDGQWRKIP